MSRTYRRCSGADALPLRQAALAWAFRSLPACPHRCHACDCWGRRVDPRSPPLVAAVRRLQQDRRSHDWSNPPHAHRQIQNRRDRYAMAQDLRQWHPDRDDPAHHRHRHSEQRRWDWW